MLRITSATDEQFRDLRGRIHGAQAEVSGELVVTSIPIASSLILPCIARFCAAHTEARVRYVASSQVLRLEYGEAHVAIRAGGRPDDPDNVVQPWRPLRSGLYVHRAYVSAHGMPDLATGLAGHALVEASRAPVRGWMAAAAPAGRVVLSTTDDQVARQAVRAGLGVYPVHEAQEMPELVAVGPANPDWSVPLWIVTHVDLRRTAKVQALTQVLRNGAT